MQGVNFVESETCLQASGVCGWTFHVPYLIMQAGAWLGGWVRWPEGNGNGAPCRHPSIHPCWHVLECL